MRIDLHTHSNRSDGTESPADLVRSAREAGLDVVALTDHDTVSGWASAARAGEESGVRVVPGMELSTRSPHGVSIHMLAYVFDPAAPGLRAEARRSFEARIGRGQAIVERLAADYPISWDLVQEHTQPGTTIGRPHIADALVSAGVVADRGEAFATLLHGSSPYYVPHYAPEAVTAVRLIREAGGVPVFAHPLADSRGRVVGEDVFDELVAAGLGGLEVNHRDNPPAAKEWLTDYAHAHDLIVTGSSDYHGAGKPNRLGENLTAEDQLERILDQGLSVEAVLRGVEPS